MARVLVVLLACIYLPTIDTHDDYRSRQLQSYAPYNEPCMTSRDCKPFGYVCKNNKTCDCDKMFAVNSDKTQCLGGVDQKCTYDEHCIPGAFCMNQAICKCKDTTPFILEDGMICAKSDVVKIFERMWVLLSLVIIWLK